MGINYNAKIASSGLVLHLDAGNTRSGTSLNRNLFTNAEDFTNSYWAKNQTTVLANQALAPDGTMTGDLITATNQYPIVSVTNPATAVFPVNAGEYYTVSCYVKYINQQYCSIVNEVGVPNLTVRFDLIGGTASGSSYAYGITPAANGWWRIYATYIIPSGYTAWNPQPIRIGQYDGTNYNGSQMYAWGAQLEMGTTATTYYPVSNLAIPTAINDLSGYDNHATLAPYALTSVEVLVVAGGGGGGPDVGGGGGAGGVIYNNQYSVLPNTTYNVVVGAGGTGGVNFGANGTNGNNSQFDNIIAIGGGAGGSYNSAPGNLGGSGGGGGGGPSDVPGGSIATSLGNSVTVPVALGLATTTTPFTFDVWVYPTVQLNGTALFANSFQAGNAVPFAVAGGTGMGSSSGSNLNFGYYNGSSWSGIQSSSSLPLNQWSHVAATFDGTTARLYLNGVQIASGNPAGGWTTVATVSPFRIGRRWDVFGGSDYFIGRITNFRAVIGTALYTGTTLTVPTGPLSAVAGTQILLKASTSGTPFTDSSTNNYTLSLVGSPTWSADAPFSPSTSLNSGSGIVGQGNAGSAGTTAAYAAGGGGGAGGPGLSANFASNVGGGGGPGVAYNISGTLTYYGGGGGGGGGSGTTDGRGYGGIGGGGTGASRLTAPGSSLTAAEKNGQANTGGGGGGTGGWNDAGAGGSGIVIVRYKGLQRATGGTVTTVGEYTVHTFTSTGSTTFVTNSSSLPAYSASYGGVLQFNGTNNFLMVPNSSSLSLTGDLTLSIWYYATSAINGLGLITKGPEQSDYDYMMYLTGSSLALNFYKKDLAGTGVSGSGGGGVTTRAWYNSVVVVQSGVYSQYVNGALVFSSTLASPTIRTSSNPVRIGRGWANGYFQGYIGPTHIYNRALSATEVLGNFNAMRGRFGI